MMKKALHIVSVVLFSTLTLCAQIQAVCDVVEEMPNTLSFDFFVAQNEISTYDLTASQEYRLDITKDSLEGQIIFIDDRQILAQAGLVKFTLSESVYFSLDVQRLFDHINDNPDSEYFARLYIRESRWTPWEPIGSQQLSAVPYALVANVWGGKGETGDKGDVGQQGGEGSAGGQSPPGPAGPQGFQGPRGEAGKFDFENNLLLMTNQVPTSGTLYVDDGSNTFDGKPRLRYNLNGTWIDL